MNWNDYEAIWKRQPLPVGETADLAELRKNFEDKHRKMAYALLVRDWVEIVACGAVVVTYLWFWHEAGPAGWPLGVASLLILGVAAFFLHERRRARRNRLGADASLKAKVEADLAELRHQRWLLLKVWVWYIAPCAVAMLLHVSVMVGQDQPPDSWRAPVLLGLAGLIIGLACWFAWTVNREAVKKQIDPRIEELEKLQRDLVAGG
jgi:hypothetical protein